MSYTLGEAAKATGKSKPTIQRAIKNGKISGEKDSSGRYYIDPSELHRIFPALQHYSNNDVSMKQNVTDNETSILQHEIDMLRERLGEKDNVIDDLKQDRDHWRQQATALLKDDRQKQKGFWARLFGKTGE